MFKKFEVLISLLSNHKKTLNNDVNIISHEEFIKKQADSLKTT